MSLAVLIPAHNAAGYICEALDSVAQQSRPPDEIVVVDDGSSDGTGDRVEAWSRDARRSVRLIRQSQVGVAAARNSGLRLLQTDLVALLDADDLFLPQHLERSEAAFLRHPDLVLCFADIEVYSARGLERARFLPGTALESLDYKTDDLGLHRLEDSAYRSLLPGNYMPVSTTVFNRRAVERIAGYDEALINAADRDLNLRLSRVGPFAYYPGVHARKRTPPDHLSHRRHELRAQRYRVAVLRKMWNQRESLQLSLEEVVATRSALRGQARQLLFTASELGLASYANACGYVVGKGLATSIGNPKHLGKALLSSWLRRAR